MLKVSREKLAESYELERALMYDFDELKKKGIYDSEQHRLFLLERAMQEEFKETEQDVDKLFMLPYLIHTLLMFKTPLENVIRAIQACDIEVA